MKLLVISSSLNPLSRSRVLARRARELLEGGDAEVDFLDLQDHPLPLCDGGAAFRAPETLAVAERLRAADGLLSAVPVYAYQVSAAFKNLVELTGREAWGGKVAAFLCAAGGHRSYMSVMSMANSLMLDYRTVVVPRYVYAAKSSFTPEGELEDPEVEDRLAELAAEFTRFTRALRAG